MVNFDTDKLTEMRSAFEHKGFDVSEAARSPIDQFKKWFAEVNKVRSIDANAMTIATSTPDGCPSARVVLLKQVDENGFVFYTNYTSSKSKDLESNPKAALVFYWPELGRQIRIEGEVSKVTHDETAAYFRSRPRKSQIAAWASYQSKKIKDRAELETRFARLKDKYENMEIPIPDFWGGYRLKPYRFEFWQGRPNRLHDRIEYEFDKSDDSWHLSRLAP